MARPRTISDEDIVSTTRACVLKLGAHVTLDAVADALGVTSPALLRRFGSRQELFIRALGPEPEPPWMQWLAQGPDKRPLTEQLEEFFGHMAKWLTKAMSCMMALKENGISPKEVYARYSEAPPLKAVAALKAWLERGQAIGILHTDSSAVVASAIFGAVQFKTFVSHFVSPDASGQSLSAYCAELAQFFAHALVPAKQTTRKRNT